ncbi:MAG TPA: hypothetical protein PLI12_08820, partial [Acetobacteraceae bacterium]|nr:hypothetical protein [Acetobacteraceae bacterium]
EREMALPAPWEFSAQLNPVKPIYPHGLCHLLRFKTSDMRQIDATKGAHYHNLTVITDRKTIIWHEKVSFLTGKIK